MAAATYKTAEEFFSAALGDGEAVLSLSEGEIDSWWHSLLVEQKAEAMADNLDARAAEGAWVLTPAATKAGA